MSGIYKITCTASNRFYIGQAQKFEVRRSRHLNDLRKGRHANTELLNCFNKYGETSLEFILLKECPIEWLDRFEQLWLDQYFDHELCMNECKEAGTCRGIKRSADTRKRISDALTGDKHPLFGLHHTVEHKKKISEAVTGKMAGENNPMYGKTHSFEAREKIKDASTGRKHSDTSKVKMSTQHQKEYDFTDPNGRLIHIINLTKFCIENNLGQGHMVEVNLGKRKQHKGWKAISGNSIL